MIPRVNYIWQLLSATPASTSVARQTADRPETWLINELIPVMENLAAIGVPGFPRLSKLLERLKNTVSKEEEEK